MLSKVIKPYVERAVIEINGGCNYTCQMCPQTNPGRHKGFLKKMSIDDFSYYAKQCIDRGVKVVNLEGSGEATLNRNLPHYIQILTDYNIKSFIFSNGFKFKGDLMKQCVDAGLSRIRFSIIGYNPEKYKEWMNRDAFELVKQNAIKAQEYISKSNGVTEIASYHLITDNTLDICGMIACYFEVGNFFKITKIKLTKTLKSKGYVIRYLNESSQKIR